jgi:hypothetical protein
VSYYLWSSVQVAIFQSIFFSQIETKKEGIKAHITSIVPTHILKGRRKNVRQETEREIYNVFTIEILVVDYMKSYKLL